MFTFKNYLKLPKNLRALAVQALMEELVKHLQETKPKSLSQVFLKRHKYQIPKNWLRQKIKGEPIRLPHHINQIMSSIPSCRQALFHPLWWVLGELDWEDETSLTNILLGLDLKFRQKFTTQIGQEIKIRLGSFNSIRSIRNIPSLDALTALLVIYIYKRYHLSSMEGLEKIEESCFNCLIKFITLEVQLIEPFSLYSAVKPIFFDYQSNQNKLSSSVVTNKPEFPTLFHHIDNEQQFIMFIFVVVILYHELLKDSRFWNLRNVSTLKEVSRINAYAPSIYQKLVLSRKPY